MPSNGGRTFRVLWADDVRQEEGEKLSIIGVYNTILEVAKGATLPKLYAFAELSTPINRPFKSVRFVAKANDRELLDVTLPDGAMTGMSEQIEKIRVEAESLGENEEARVALRAGLPFFGVTVTEPTNMTLTAETEEGELHGEVLRIRPTGI